MILLLQIQYLEGVVRSNEAMIADLEADNVHQTKVGSLS